MSTSRQRRSIIVLVLLLAMATVVIIFAPPLIDQRMPPLPKQPQNPNNISRELSLSHFNNLQTPQDDPSLVEFIKRKILIPPAPFGSKLNISHPIVTSPQAEVVSQLLKNKTNGFFVECGAFDGEYISNSIALEHHFQWTGLLVEADPISQQRLLRRNRKAWIAPVCMSPKPYPISTTFQHHKHPGEDLSNIYHLYTSRNPHDFKVFEVQCLPFYSLLLALNQTQVDYFSLDTEGADLSILQTIPFDKLEIKILSVESSKGNEKSESINQQIEAYMKSKGYRMHVFIEKDSGDTIRVRDYIFVKESVGTNGTKV